MENDRGSSRVIAAVGHSEPSQVEDSILNQSRDSGATPLQLAVIVSESGIG
jgi:hypothetical protein